MNNCVYIYSHNTMDMEPTKTEPPFVSDERLRDHVRIGFSRMFGVSHTDVKGLTPHEVRDIYEAELSRLRTEHLTQLAERDKVIEGLMKYAEHTFDCTAKNALARRTPDTRECTCGLDQRLSTLKKP